MLMHYDKDLPDSAYENRLTPGRHWMLATFIRFKLIHVYQIPDSHAWTPKFDLFIKDSDIHVWIALKGAIISI